MKTGNFTKALFIIAIFPLISLAEGGFSVPKTPSVPQPPAVPSVSRKLVPQMLTNVNTAQESDIAKLPGIGTDRAKAIVAGRPYSSVQDLTKVPGLTQGIVDKIKPLISVK